MRAWIFSCMAALAVTGAALGWTTEQAKSSGANPSPSINANTPPPAIQAPAQQPQQPQTAQERMSDEDKANQLSDQVGKLMVKCVNLLTAQDPLSLDYCKQQRDLAEQYPPGMRVVDTILAHDEYGIALAAFDHKQEALAEFDQEIVLLPKASKQGTVEWSTAYWHRAMLYAQLGDAERADHDYRAAEESFRRQQREQSAPHPDKRMRAVLRQHAALLQKQGKTEAAQKLLDEASK
jgi:tetratricopeptide (TPR) repeat protein